MRMIYVTEFGVYARDQSDRVRVYQGVRCTVRKN